MFGEDEGILVDLHCEFAGGGEDEGAGLGWLGGVGFGGGVGEEVVEAGEEEGEGFAGAGLGLSGDIFAV